MGLILDEPVIVGEYVIIEEGVLVYFDERDTPEDFDKEAIEELLIEVNGDTLTDTEDVDVFDNDWELDGVLLGYPELLDELDLLDDFDPKAELLSDGDGVLDNKYKETWTTTPLNTTLPSEVICNLIELELI